jgi:Holliday junction DNA helicase RuvA
MIGQIKGKIVNKKPTQSLIDVNGMGYIVNTSINTFEKIPDEGEVVSLFTYLSVREDSLTLYGFFTISEKEIFEMLIGVNGVGPKLAQNILSGITSEEFKEAVINNNISRLVAIPGVGRKTAERMIIELRDKIIKVGDSESEEKSAAYSLREDAVAAMVGLGYNHKTADKLVRDLLGKNPSLSLEDLIKESLKNLTK